MTKINVITETKTVEGIKKAIGGEKQAMRQTFDSIEKANAAFAKVKEIGGESLIMLRPIDAEGKPDDSVFAGEQITVGMDSEGNAVTGSSVQIVLAIVGERVKSEDKGAVGVRAVILFPQPHPAAFMQDQDSLDWLAKIVEKEASHVQFRSLRNAGSVEELESAFAAQPTTIEEIRSSSRADSIDTSVYDAVYSAVRAAIKKQQPTLDSLLPGKAELLRAIRSKAFAEHIRPEVESRGLFVKVAEFFIRAADGAQDSEGNPLGYDTTTIQTWIDDRDSVPYNPVERAEVSADELDKLSSLSLGFE